LIKAYRNVSLFYLVLVGQKYLTLEEQTLYFHLLNVNANNYNQSVYRTLLCVYFISMFDI